MLFGVSGLVLLLLLFSLPSLVCGDTTQLQVGGLAGRLAGYFMFQGCMGFRGRKGLQTKPLKLQQPPPHPHLAFTQCLRVLYYYLTVFYQFTDCIGTRARMEPSRYLTQPRTIVPPVPHPTPTATLEP